jgi:indole-3-glycerol phosphate synthase
MADILQKIYTEKAEHLAREEAAEPYGVIREQALARKGERRKFVNALEIASGAGIIAEVKRASPSAGLISRNFDPAAIAVQYEAAGVDAISVLTEQDHFLGELGFLDIVRAHSSKPILRKDFLTNRYGVAQSAAYGADCILLIVAGLDDAALSACMDEAQMYGLDVLVEIHDAAELTRALKLGATFVGINNRNLRTFETDLAVSEHLLPNIPSNVFAISESGMRDPTDIRRLRSAGARGFLIGEALMRTEEPAEFVTSLKQAK